MSNNQSEKKYILQGVFILIGLIYLVRLFYLQVVEESYSRYAQDNVLQEQVIYPARGLVYDRDGRLLVYNDAVYDLMVITSRVKDLDTTLFCQVLNISRETFDKRMKKIRNARGYSRFKPSVFEKQLTIPVYAAVQEKLYDFPGFFVEVRTDRKYKYEQAAHVMGYIGEVTRKQIDNSEGYYRMGDYIGISGVERTYEEHLRGQRGIRYVMVDNLNRVQGTYKNGQFDTMSVAGKSMVLTLDQPLQAYGEKLMERKIGSIVAIEPHTGEILALVSSPAYDPNLFIGRERGNNYAMLSQDSVRPLFNRPLGAPYPPGSIFKVIMSLVGQQEGVLFPQTSFGCNGGWRFVGCHAHASPVALQGAIAISCNAYFCQVFRKVIDNRAAYPNTEEAYKSWRKHIRSFGLGDRLGIDLPGEVKGILKETTYYDKIYGRHRWKSSTIISLAIGQGELGVTPLQMANATAIIANRGYYRTPHIVRAIDGKAIKEEKYTQKQRASVDSVYYPLVIDAMEDVVNFGTARIAKIKDIALCGKTGTAQNPHGEDHSVFFAFAPKENPKIAIAVVVENAGWGGSFAAPISSLMIEKYLTDSATTRPWLEERMLNAEIKY